MKQRKKCHPPYYAIPAFIILAKTTKAHVARELNMSVRTFTDKINGYGDFSHTQGERLATILNRSMQEIFLT